MLGITTSNRGRNPLVWPVPHAETAAANEITHHCLKLQTKSNRVELIRKESEKKFAEGFEEFAMAEETKKAEEGKEDSETTAAASSEQQEVGDLHSPAFKFRLVFLPAAKPSRSYRAPIFFFFFYLLNERVLGS